MHKGYTVSKTLVERISSRGVKELCAGRAVDLGWWSRFYGPDKMSVEQQQQLLEEDIEQLEEEWRTELNPLKMAELLSEYADGFYSARLRVAEQFRSKKRDSSPILIELTDEITC